MKRNAMPAGRQGFTLIELLVVIGIIGMLVSIAIPNFLSARQRASDSKKKSEMAQLKNALRLYYNDFNTYPDSFTEVGKFNYIKGCGAGGTGNCPCTAGSVDFASGAACDNVYMKKFPSSLGIETIGTYYYKATSGDDFCLRAILDNTSDPDIATSQSRCATACGANCTGGASTGRYCVCAD